MPCNVCDRIALWTQNRSPFFICEFEHSIGVVGDHQFYPGYALILSKIHVRELHELPKGVAESIYANVMSLGRAIVEEFHPWKMNYACYGNQDPHVHWHLFPRYESDPNHRTVPWTNMALFDGARITESEAQGVVARLRSKLHPVLSP